MQELSENEQLAHARERAAEMYGGSLITRGDFHAGWDAALEWVRERQLEEKEAACRIGYVEYK